MSILVLVTGLVISHAPLPEYVEVSSSDLELAIYEVFPKVPRSRVSVVIEGAKLGGMLGGIHPAWLVVMAYHESRMNPKASGDCVGGKCKAYGLCQIHFHTGKSVVKGLSRSVLRKPVVNMAVAGLLYGRYIRKYGRRKAHVIYAAGGRCMSCTTTPTFKKRYRNMKKILKIVSNSGGKK